MAQGCYTWNAFALLILRQRQAPLKRLGRQMEASVVDSDARWFLAIPDNKRPMPRPDSSVVERGPEKAGVGGSIPSLATI
jgi:hypothetical protein